MDNQQHTVNIYNQYVKEYVARFMGLDLYQDTFEPLIELLPPHVKVLELGCGPGNVVRYLKSKRSDLDILGIDLAPEMIKEAQRQNPDARFEVMDLRLAHQLNQKFNALIAAFCLPYISYKDTEALFKSFDHLAAGDALLYVSFMEGPPERSGYEQTSFTGTDEIYINYYERSVIEALLKAHHYTIEAFYTKDYPETDGSITTDVIYLAKKNSLA